MLEQLFQSQETNVLRQQKQLNVARSEHRGVEMVKAAVKWLQQAEEQSDPELQFWTQRVGNRTSIK